MKFIHFLFFVKEMKNISLYVDRKGTIFHTLKTKRELCLLESGLNLFWQKSVNLKWISLCVWV